MNDAKFYFVKFPRNCAMDALNKKENSLLLLRMCVCNLIMNISVNLIYMLPTAFIQKIDAIH